MNTAGQQNDFPKFTKDIMVFLDGQHIAIAQEVNGPGQFQTVLVSPHQAELLASWIIEAATLLMPKDK